MKSIISLFIVFIFALTGCDNPFEARFHDIVSDVREILNPIDSSRTLDSKDYTKWYSAKVYVKYENGDSCEDSYAVQTQDSLYFYSDIRGFIFVVKMYSFESENFPDSQTILCNIYMDDEQPLVFVQQEFIMKHSGDIPQYNVVFPN